jgi:hypothetical protein
MQSLLAFLSSNAILQTWRRISFLLKAAIIFGVGVFASSEVTEKFNQALNSYAKSSGEGEAGLALTADQTKTRRDMNAGLEVSGAKRRAVVEYEGQEAQAQKTHSEALAYNETEAQLLAKKTLKIPLTTTEELRLIELQTKRAEAQTKIAQASSAAAEARANKEAAELNSRLLESIQRNDGDILKTFYDIVVPKGVLGK